MTLARAAFLAALLVLAAPVAAFAGDGVSAQIVGGTLASAGEYPAQGGLYIDLDDDGIADALCGGTLVGGRQFLTAAHCAEGLSPSAFTVYLGEIDRNNFGSGNAHLVSAVDVNSDYNGATHQNDTAMLTLSEPVGFRSLPIVGTDQSSLWAPGVSSTIIGWGSTTSMGSASRFLREAQVPMVSDSTCAADYPGMFDSQTMVCAADGTHDTCQGDSGGPLMVPAPAGGFVLAGVTSWGIGCAQASHPGVYARIGAEPLHSWVTARLPHVGFSSSPGSPRNGDTVTFDAGPSGPAGYFSSFSWDLDGDGQYNDATGSTASRAFPQGSHTVGVQGDGPGGEAVASRSTISVAPDVTRPSISSASASPRVFAVDRKGASEKAASAAKKGTSLRYKLSEKARVAFTVARALAGRRSGKKCVRQTTKNRGKRRCTRYARFGRFAVASAAGSDSHHYKGRIGKRAMKPGSYRVTLLATDGAGNRSKAKALKLRVVRR